MRPLVRVPLVVCGGALAVAGVCLYVYVSGPVDVDRLNDVAATVLAADGRLLDMRLNSEGMWREPVSFDGVDRDFIDALIAFEDRRFFSHFGVDPLAIARAALSLVTEGRVVSGGSSLTMQVARLLQPDLRQRSFGAKLRQALYALRLEHHWSKREILQAYLTLAPYGGNVEGIKAAAMAWLLKSPGELTMSEIGLLVALPQAPERRRPDRFPHAVIRAKNHVLNSIADDLALETAQLDEYLAEVLPLDRYFAPSLAPHLLDRNFVRDGYVFGRPTTIYADWQETTARVLSERVQRLAAPINGAALVVERKTGYVRAYVGSANYLDTARKGAVNYLQARRSPGSTLKPFIYAAAIERRLIADDQIFHDRPLQQGGYAPANFDGKYSGTVTLRDALVRSRNVPAIEVLHAIGETSFENKLRSFIGSSAARTKYAGLSLAVGGFYLTLEDLAELYLSLSDPISSPRLSFLEAASRSGPPLVTQAAAERIQALLAVTLPNGRIRVAKTGTSHNRQDALTVLVTRYHVIVVWFGTPDGEPTQVLTGAAVALPVAERLQAALGLADPTIAQPPKTKPAGALALTCPPLIDFPEDGEWLRTEDKRVAVSGTRRTIRWFLDGVAASVSNGAITVPSGGAFRITAADGECRETSEVFVELVS